MTLDHYLGPGATIGVLATGVPRLACLQLAAWLKQWPSTARLHQPYLKTLARGHASRGGRCKVPQGRPHQADSRGGGEIKARATSCGAHDASHDDQDQAGASLRSVLISSLVQRGQVQARTTKASGKGFHISATRPRPTEWQDRGHRGAQDGVITSAFGSQRPPLVRIACTSCPLSKWPLLAPFPLNILEEDQDLYK